MCLNIKTLFLPNRLVVPVYKYLDIAETNNGTRYVTGFQYTPIPPNGWLLPHDVELSVDKYSNIRGSTIDGGFIHSAINPVTGRGCDIRLPAFAVGIVATGIHEDLVSLALYIPALDQTRNQLPLHKQLFTGAYIQDALEDEIPEKLNATLLKWRVSPSLPNAEQAFPHSIFSEQTN